MARGRRIPLFRLGLLLMVGGVMVSVVSVYIGLGQSFASMSGDAPTKPEDITRRVVHDLLLTIGTPGVLFWLGVALVLASVVRLIGRRG